MTSVALVGPGRHGTAIAQLFASHGVDVTLYHHREAKGRAAADQVRRAARDADVTLAPGLRDAVDGQELVLLTTLWDAAQREVISDLGDALVGKVLLEVSNPLDVTPAGIIPRRPVQGSAGQFVATLLPDGAGHVKAFSNIPTASLSDAADRDPRAVLPFAADSDASAELVHPYLEAIGWQPWLVGGIGRSADLEIGGAFNVVRGRWGRACPDATEMAAYAGPEATTVSAPAR